MRTIEQLNALLATPEGRREINEWAEEFVFGHIRCDGWVRGDFGIAKTCDHDQGKCFPANGRTMFQLDYTTDPAAAEQVRQRAAKHPLFGVWADNVWALAANRGVRRGPMEVVLQYGQPSDYVGAFWLLDADEELKQQCTTPPNSNATSDKPNV